MHECCAPEKSKYFRNNHETITSRRLRPITTAKAEAAKGNPCPIWPYAFPANDAAIPRSARVVAKPRENAIEFPITYRRRRKRNAFHKDDKFLKKIARVSQHIQQDVTSYLLLPEPNAPVKEKSKNDVTHKDRKKKTETLGEVVTSSIRDKFLPIYPRVRGNTLSVQGERLVTRPAPKITAKL